MAKSRQSIFCTFEIESPSMKLSCLIVDDETPDRELLENLIHSYCENLEVKAQANSVQQAESILKNNSYDLVFLDINMPNQIGFTLLQNFPDREFLTVITTGHDQYGIQAVKNGAFDYLLKPIDVDELIASEKKALHYFDNKNHTKQKTISIFHQGEQILIRDNEIVYLEAQGSYTNIYLVNEKDYLTSKNLQQIIEELNSKNLIRIHKSFAVNIKLINSFTSLGNEGEIMLTNEIKLKVGRKYKQNLKAYFS